MRVVTDTLSVEPVDAAGPAEGDLGVESEPHAAVPTATMAAHSSAIGVRIRGEGTADAA
ncbi:hypothetical protein [Williamsia sp. CHRR-6]|uniref:hypothetical protein n=1 Tax=Williamsia sp. CHRR-6 TaxID=2835871 RepID=UPI002023C990|nr:hypothetical protein [Williamsia sp. CHRR-6]